MAGRPRDAVSGQSSRCMRNGQVNVKDLLSFCPAFATKPERAAQARLSTLRPAASFSQPSATRHRKATGKMTQFSMSHPQ